MPFVVSCHHHNVCFLSFLGCTQHGRAAEQRGGKDIGPSHLAPKPDGSSWASQRLRSNRYNGQQSLSPPQAKSKLVQAALSQKALGTGWDSPCALPKTIWSLARRRTQRSANTDKTRLIPSETHATMLCTTVRAITGKEKDRDGIRNTVPG